MKSPLSRRTGAEFLGAGFLVAAVVGSGIMGERLANGNAALALLANSIATGAALASLIIVLGPVSGAHLNPAVTICEAWQGGMSRKEATCFIAAQICGSVGGTACANAMFALPVFSISTHARTGGPQWFSELVATFGLILIIRGCVHARPEWLPVAVACYIAAAYWFTASTSFANPAVTIARALTDTFTGIRPRDVFPFVAAQLCGAFSGMKVFDWLNLRACGA